KAASVQRVDDGLIRLTVQNGGGERALLGSHLLLATGRSPNTEALNLRAAGVETDKAGFIKVNERLETNVAGIYALGDVKGGPAAVHGAAGCRVRASDACRSLQQPVHDVGGVGAREPADVKPHYSWSTTPVPRGVSHFQRASEPTLGRNHADHRNSGARPQL